MLFSFKCLIISWMLSAVLASPIEGDFSQSESKCHGCRGIQGNDTGSFCGDARLGPAKLPRKGGFSAMLANYDRFGGLCPQQFLQKYVNESSGFYVYPPDNGFQLSTSGSPIDGNQTLVPGMLLDRFGSEYGMYLAPAYTPFGQRALPPTSLNNATANYHVYRVELAFTVLTGTIAMWFEQPGQGTQYYSGKNVLTLLSEGLISRVE
ncbi:hypothetical protein C8R47DRAFT_1155201 [Mycena vitilis]|nr:hypothetical protein C8R47DRAFT_1155201 [Mycena vitilis]